MPLPERIHFTLKTQRKESRQLQLSLMIQVVLSVSVYFHPFCIDLIYHTENIYVHLFSVHTQNCNDSFEYNLPIYPEASLLDVPEI